MYNFSISATRETRTGSTIDTSSSYFVTETKGENAFAILSIIGAANISQLRWSNVKEVIIFEKVDPPRGPGIGAGFLVYEIEVKEIPSVITNVFGLQVEV